MKSTYFVCVLAATGLLQAQKTVTTTGGAANNVAKFSGSTTIVNSAIFENNGNVGIGTTSPADPFNVVSAPIASSGSFINSFLQMSPNPSAASSAVYLGLKVETATKNGSTVNFSSPLFGSLLGIDHYGTGSLTSAYGVEAQIANHSTGTLTDAYSLWSELQNTGKGTITNGFGLRIGAPVNTGGGKITNFYGIYVESPTAGSANYALYAAGGTSYFAGNVGIGVSAPTSPLTVKGVIQSISGGIKFPDGTTQATAEVEGPAGPQGPQGPPGPPLSLPYSASVSSSSTLFAITNTGQGAAIQGNGGPDSGSGGGSGVIGNGGIGNFNGGGTGVIGNGGSDPAAPGAGVIGTGGSTSGSGAGANGVEGYGGAADRASAGVGGYFEGNGGWYNGSSGVQAFGGSGIHDNGGDGIDATGTTGGYGVVATNGGQGPDGTPPYAGIFNGDVDITGKLSKGSGSFKIDDPLDPANKYLYHSFVESPDMMNIYNGNVVTDGRGMATVTLPDWFEALNRDFRYQLTVVGQFAQAIVATEVHNNEFTIRTDKPGVKVSWQVTGIRQDAYANAHRIPVEQDKPEKERGHYLYPDLFGHADDDSVFAARHPDLYKRIQQYRARHKEQ